MARAPDPRIDQAREMYLAGEKLINIAKQLDLPEGTVRRWKCTYKWGERSNAKSEGSQKGTKVKRKRGAQPGNKNSSGGPPGNKKAVKTGEFETLLFDCLDEEEKRLIESTPKDKQRLLLQEIGFSSVRERRMLKRIEAIKQSEGYMGEEGLTLVSIETGEEGTKKKYEGKLGQIQAIEEAITRVQARKQRAIEFLHKFGFDDEQIRLETRRLEMAVRANGEVGEEEEQDDGFLDALKGSVDADWEGWEDGVKDEKASDI